MPTSSTAHQPTPLDCILDPALAPKPANQGPSFNLTITNSTIGGVQIDAYHQRLPSIPVDDQRRPTHTIDAVRPSFQAFCGREDDGVMVYPPACADMSGVHYTGVDPAVPGSERTGWIEIDVPPLHDKIQASRLHGFTYGICQPFDPDKYTFTPEEGRRLRMFAEQVCGPHDTHPERAGDFDRTAAFELAKMIHAKYQANVEIARILKG